jgi:hypothetical protein
MYLYDESIFESYEMVERRETNVTATCNTVSQSPTNLSGKHVTRTMRRVHTRFPYMNLRSLAMIRVIVEVKVL